jgi:FdhE protein
MEEQLRQCYQHGLPPRSFQNGFQTWGGQVWGQSKKRESTRESTWQHALQFIVSSLDRPDLPEQMRAAIQRLEQTKAEALERWADALLRGALPNAERALAPFLAAALQVYWVKLASALDAEALSPREDSPICPVCGSPPVAGIVRMGGDVHALRYLSCPLCATEWHMVRIKCSHCLSTQGIAYHSIEGDKGAVKGETCSNSHFDDFTLFLAAGERVRSYAA